MSDSTFSIKTKYGVVELYAINDTPGGGEMLLSITDANSTAVLSQLVKKACVSPESLKAYSDLDPRRIEIVMTKYMEWNNEYEKTYVFNEDDL